jgi:hypothetical protein
LASARRASPAATATNAFRSLAVASGIDPNRARPAALPDVRDELAQAVTEGPVVRGAADDRHVVRAGGDEPTTVVLGERRAGHPRPSA